MTRLAQLSLTLALGAAVMTACMEPAPIPEWVLACVEVQGGPDCAPQDTQAQPTSEDNEAGPDS